MATVLGLLILGGIATVVVMGVRKSFRWSRSGWSQWLSPRLGAIASGAAQRVIGKSVERARQVAQSLAGSHSTVVDAQKDPRFHEAAYRLASGPVTSAAAALRAAQDDDLFLAAIGLTALARRAALPESEGVVDWAVGFLSTCRAELEPLVYRVILSHAERPVIGSVISKIDEGIDRRALAEFIAARLGTAEPAAVETFAGRVPYRHVALIGAFADEYSATLGQDFREAFELWAAGAETAAVSNDGHGRVLVDDDQQMLSSFSRLWERPFDDPPAILVGDRADIVDRIESALRETRRSILLVGTPGVGKTALVRAATERLPKDRVVFEAGAAETYAGCVYVGELETKIERIASITSSSGALWVFPKLDEAIFAGQHSRSPRGMLDALQPHLVQGNVVLVGEVSEAGFERLASERPGLLASFEVIRVRALDIADSVAVARSIAAYAEIEVDEETLNEAYELTRQFMVDLAPPGNLVRLMSDTVDDALDRGQRTLVMQDFLDRLSSVLGLPLVILDRGTPLDLTSVHDFFSARVLHQPDAIAAVVERISMVKAGLTDPDRPFAVLFLVGPTGTGKTELAKALAEFMFGSPERMIRLDMSEYVTAEGLERLLASGASEGQSGSLLAEVRKDPFSVVLLDEIEKAAPPVWDLLLQVFDDGRLTSHRGETVDFRRTVIVLTSNLGSAFAAKADLGFAAGARRFDSGRIREAVTATFRPEFVNRIDRVVVFRPFEPAHMHELLDKELAAALNRRGLRARPWAIELEPEAREFLTERGFSREFGARPLKRAIEQFVLAPLAAAMVGHGVPEGEQFLLLRVDGEGLRVEFVDPDSAARGSDQAPLPHPSRADSAKFTVSGLALAPEDSRSAVAYLSDQFQRFDEASIALQLDERREAALASVNESGFWERSSRYGTLAEVEYLDRFRTAVETGRKLSHRLRLMTEGAGDKRERIQQLAVRLHVLDSALSGFEAGAAFDVFMRLRAWSRTAARSGAGDASFVAALGSMYAGWASRRGMQLRRIDATHDEHLYAVSGLGCAWILEQESGLHTFSPGRERDATASRGVVQVCVAPWEPGPADQQELLAEQASEAFRSIRCESRLVRRYQTGGSPLVKDAIRGYRTGRIGAVLSGDFDLFV